MNGFEFSTAVWSGIEAADPPEYRRDYPELLDMAEAMLAERKTRFPDLVARNRISQAEADAEIRIFEHIVQDWRFIARGDGEPAPASTLIARREALSESIAKIAAIARRAHGFSEELAHRAQCVIALRWHLEPGRPTVAFARINHRHAAIAAKPQGSTAHVPTSAQ